MKIEGRERAGGDEHGGKERGRKERGSRVVCKWKESV